jgi:hypothetical protein
VFVLKLIIERLRAAGSWMFRQIGRRWKVALLLLPVAIIAVGLAAYGCGGVRSLIVFTSQ